MKNNILISVAMIVKNEEAVLSRFLTCLKGLADEIIIVDTGSTDKTKEIAESHEKVKFYSSKLFNEDTPTCDFSFSKARNESISKCSGKFIIWFDADDYISSSNIDEIKAKVKEFQEFDTHSHEPVGFSFNIKYGKTYYRQYRMFTNFFDIKFDEEHSCHEFLKLPPAIVHLSNVTVEHLPVKGRDSSVHRNLEIMLSDLSKNGGSSRLYFYIANSFRELGKFSSAISYYNKHLSCCDWKEERFFSRFYTALCYKEIGDLTRAKEQAILCCVEDDRFAENFCLLGDLSFISNKLQEAQCWYNMAAIKQFPKDSMLFANKFYYGTYPEKQFNLCQHMLDNIAKS